MQFIANKITNPANTDNQPTWNEWVKNYFEKEAAKKEASEAKPECNDDSRGACRGQVANNDNEPEAHSYQEGESVDGKPDQAEGKGKGKKDKDASAEVPEIKAAHCDKDMGECSKAGDVTEEHSDAANADVGDAQVASHINNDPNYQKGESTDGSKVNGKNKKEHSKSKDASTKRGFKKVASLDHKEKLQLFAHMSTRKTKSGSPQWPISYVEAMTGIKFANLKDDEKSWFKKFWETQYPGTYVSEMVADR